MVSYPISCNANSLRNAHPIDNPNHLNSAVGVRRSSFRRVMTPHDESLIPSEVTSLMPFLTTSATINLGMWNVRTMRGT